MFQILMFRKFCLTHELFYLQLTNGKNLQKPELLFLYNIIIRYFLVIIYELERREFCFPVNLENDFKQKTGVAAIVIYEHNFKRV